MSTTPQHNVAIVVGRQEIPNWTEYDFAASMLQPSEVFTLTRPYDEDAYDLCEPDTKVTVTIDGTPILTGLIDDLEVHGARSGLTMTVRGRDLAGRMVQESAPLFSFDNLDLFEILRRLADPWFPSVVTSNARNRRVMRGKLGRQVAGGNEPLIVRKRRRTWRVDPGKTRWAAAEELTSEAGYILFAASDGTELIVGKPNYTQDNQFRFLVRPDAINVGEYTWTRSNADRYSMIVAVGAGGGDAANYGASTVSRRGIVRNGPKPDGTGLDFQYPKRMIMGERTMQDVDEAELVAQREMARRDFKRQSMKLSVPNHGQTSGGTVPTIFTFDTLAEVDFVERKRLVQGSWCIHACRYTSTRGTGERTEIDLVPKGTEFVQ